MLLDILVVGIPLGVLNAILNATVGTQHLVGDHLVRSLQGGSEAVVAVISTAITALYFAILNGTNTGQTIGDRAPGIAVRDIQTGEPIGFGRGLLRWFIRTILYVALVIPGVLNDLWPIWDRQNQSLADKVARSVVVRLK